MTKEDAIWWVNHLFEIRKEEYFNKGMMKDAKEVEEAQDMAIEALSKPIVDITQRDLCADISCTDCPFMKETCKLMDYVASTEAVQGETVPVIPVKVKNFKVDKIPDDWEPSILGKQKRPRKKIYIAGPVTGVEGYEETFAKAADALRAKGYEPVNPVAPGIVEGYSYRDYINRGFQMLMDCDGMLLLPGYMDSKGAALELHYALAVGMEIIKG